MKKLFFIVAMMLSLAVYSAPTPDSIQVTQAERIIDKYSGKVYATVTEVVEQLKGPAKEMFDAVVRLEIAKGFGYLLPKIFTFLFLFLFVKEYKRILDILNRDNVPRRYDRNGGPFSEENSSFQLIMYLVVAFLMFSMALIFTYDGLLHLFAPEWYAIKEIIELVK
jgi:hypothetical protein